MRSYRPLDDVTVEYFTQHPEEIEPFLNERFAEYAVDGDAAALLAALRVSALPGDFVAGRGDRHDAPGAAKGAAGQRQAPSGHHQCDHAGHGLSATAPSHRGKCGVTGFALVAHAGAGLASDALLIPSSAANQRPDDLRGRAGTVAAMPDASAVGCGRMG